MILWSACHTQAKLPHRLLRLITITTVLILFITLLTTPPGVNASLGDVQPEYQECVEQCTHTDCERKVGDAIIQVNNLPWHLQLLRWSCPDDCRYRCQHSVTAARLTRGESVLQYHGKWPFTRLLGIQEPASVLFSVLNGYGHWRYLPRAMRWVTPRYYLRRQLFVYSLVGLNAWLWSSVFHTRDTPLTEKLDCFSAGWSILYGLYLAVCRVWRIRTTSLHRLVLGVTCGVFLVHVTYLALRTRFDYSYNITACATVGMMHNMVWFVWTIRNRKQRPYAWRAMVGVVYVTAAMALELFDFPPIAGMVDAHALWHAATIPLVFWWYRFLLLDYDWELKTLGGRVLLPLTEHDTHEGRNEDESLLTQPLVNRSRKLKD